MVEEANEGVGLGMESSISGEWGGVAMELATVAG